MKATLGWMCLVVQLLYDTQPTTADTDGEVLRVWRNALRYSLFNRPSCGLQLIPQPRRVSSRIWGGENAYLGQYPWIVNIFDNSEKRDEQKPHCVGVTISKRYVLTAAHCCSPPRHLPFELIVRIGEYNLTTIYPEIAIDGGEVPIEDFDVEEAKIHENYVNVTSGNDICLLRVDRNFPLTEYTRPICLPMTDREINRDLTEPGLLFEIAGWGESMDGKGPVPVLQQTKVPVVSNCTPFYPLVGPKQICAGGTIETGGTYRRQCYGDSGGPLMFKTTVASVSRYVVYGLVSYSDHNESPDQKSCDIKKPGVFTRVSEYILWIMNNMY